MYINSIYFKKAGDRIAVYGLIDKSEEFLFTYNPLKMASFDAKEFVGLTAKECSELADSKKYEFSGCDNNA